MNAFEEVRRRDALHGLMGALLDEGVHPDVCRIFSPGSFDTWQWGVTLAFMEEHRVSVPPAVGMAVSWGPWQLAKLLPFFIAQLMMEHPQAARRDHLLGGYFALSMGRWLPDRHRERMGEWSDWVVMMTRSDDAAARAPDAARKILDSYDCALAKVAAWEQRCDATDTGATE